MKKGLFLLISVAVLFIAGNKIFAQKVNQSKTNWTLLMEKSGVQVFYKYEDCKDVQNGLFQELVYLKIVNNTKMNIQAEWDLKAFYNNETNNPEGNDPEHHYTIKLSSGETKMATCANRNSNRELVIFSKFLNMENRSTLSKFDLINFSVNPL